MTEKGVMTKLTLKFFRLLKQKVVNDWKNPSPIPTFIRCNIALQ